MAACVASSVSFAHGRQAPVVREVSASVGFGELVAIVGPNGAGKSTLLRGLAGLMQRPQGSVSLGSLDPQTATRAQLARALSFTPQHVEPAWGYTVHQVVCLGRYVHGGAASDVARLADAALATCELTALAARRFDELSGGEARRTMVAQALCQSAPRLLLDEPTAAVDPAHAKAIMAVLRQRAEAGAAVLIVTHDLHLALRYATRMWVMHEGRLLTDGAPAEVLTSAATTHAFNVPIFVGVTSAGEPFAVPL